MTAKQPPVNKADKLIYSALKKAIEQNKLRIYVDYSKINKPNSPVYNPWECLLPILIPVLLGLILIVFAGILFGLLFIIGMILIYDNVIKKRLHQKLIARTKDYIVSNYTNCCELWNFGGLVLVNVENKKIGCVAPEGDWKEFVVTNFSDLMTEDKNKKKTEEKPSDELNSEESVETDKK